MRLFLDFSHHAKNADSNDKHIHIFMQLKCIVFVLTMQR